MKYKDKRLKNKLKQVLKNAERNSCKMLMGPIKRAIKVNKTLKLRPKTRLVLLKKRQEEDQNQLLKLLNLKNPRANRLRSRLRSRLMPRLKLKVKPEKMINLKVK